MGNHDGDPNQPNKEVVEKAKIKFHKALLKVIPYGAQVLASAAAYTLGITATQLVGYCLRISCRTPVAGPLMGMVGVGLASVLSGQASTHTQKYFQTGGNPLQISWWEPIDLDDAALDSIMGIFIYKIMGGHFSSIMPSDIAKPGALAFESIPAKSDEYAKPSIKRELVRIFRRDGCHHCGSRRGPVIGDHMPPNKQVLSKGGMKLPFPEANSLLGKLMGDSGNVKQRFYPQCQRCSYKQATALRNNKYVLVLHMHGPRSRSEHLAGVFVGLRHCVPPMRAPGNGSSRRGMRWNPLQLTASPHVGLPPPMGASAPIEPDGEQQHDQDQDQLMGRADAKRHAEAVFQRHFTPGLIINEA